MSMNSKKRFYFSVIWMAAIVAAGVAMLLSFVTHA